VALKCLKNIMTLYNVHQGSGVAKGGAKGAIASPMGRVYMYNVSWLFNRINARFNQRFIDVMPLEGLITQFKYVWR
jgi:hypothetical protein